MGIPHRGVGQQQALVVADPFGELFRPKFLEPRPTACRRRLLGVKGRHDGGCPPGDWPPILHQRVTVDDCLGQEGQQPGRAILPDGEVKQARGLVDEPSGAVAGEKLRVGNEVNQKRNVRLHATNAKLLKAAFDMAGSFGVGEATSRQFHQQGVEVGRDNRP